MISERGAAKEGWMWRAGKVLEMEVAAGIPSCGSW